MSIWMMPSLLSAALHDLAALLDRRTRPRFWSVVFGLFMCRNRLMECVPLAARLGTRSGWAPVDHISPDRRFPYKLGTPRIRFTLCPTSPKFCPRSSRAIPTPLSNSCRVPNWTW